MPLPKPPPGQNRIDRIRWWERRLREAALRVATTVEGTGRQRALRDMVGVCHSYRDAVNSICGYCGDSLTTELGYVCMRCIRKQRDALSD